MPREPPTREVWERWRPTLITWYRTRTADSIAEQMKSEHGLNVTAKMLRDRFKLWNAEPKYSRHQFVQPRRPRRKTGSVIGNQAVEFSVSVSVQMFVQDDSLNGAGGSDTATMQPARDGPQDDHDPRITTISSLPGTNLELSDGSVLLNICNPFTSPEPSRTPDTPRENLHLHRTLTEIAGYLDRIVKEATWAQRHEEPTFELQKLAANAHMAISSQGYDSHHIWKELGSLYSPVRNIMPAFGENNLLTMHPRALIVLLRLLVDSVSFGVWGSQTLERVKSMFWLVTSQTLQATHPIRLLCAMPKRKATEVLFRLLELMDVRLFSRVGDQHPNGAVFVAQEQTYAARVLASLGYTQWAEFKLRSVIEDLGSHKDDFTQADAYRTLGYAREQSCTGLCPERTIPILREAKIASTSALTLFAKIGKTFSNEAMFTRVSLAQVARKLGELDEAETHLTEAIKVWQKIRSAEDQGGSKLILDLHSVLLDRSKIREARELRQQHQRYFEESKVYDEDLGS